jgi:hypothetical protein
LARVRRRRCMLEVRGYRLEGIGGGGSEGVAKCGARRRLLGLDASP